MRKTFSVIMVVLSLLFAVPAAYSQVTAYGTRVQDGTGAIMSSGQWCFGSTCLSVSNGAFSGTVTPATASVTVVNSASTIVMTVPNVYIAGGQNFNWSLYVAPMNTAITGVGMPYLPCYVGSSWNGSYWCQSYSGQLSWGSTRTPVSSGLGSGYGAPTFTCVSPCIYTAIDSDVAYQLIGPYGYSGSSWTNILGGLDVPISQGGTGATTAAGALANLGGISLTAGGTQNIAGNISVAGTVAVGTTLPAGLPVGTIGGIALYGVGNLNSQAQLFLAQAGRNNRDMHILVVSDSTAYTYTYTTTPTVTRWPYLFAQILGAKLPAYTVQFQQWNYGAGDVGPGGSSYNTLVTLQTGSGGNNLFVHNCAFPGASNYDFTSGRYAACIAATTPDLVLISMGHNWKLADPWQNVQLDLTERIAADFPNAGIILMSQNPTQAPFASPLTTPQKALAIENVARMRGYGYINVYQAFLDDIASVPGDTLSCLDYTDGEHPTSPQDACANGNNGSQLWANTVAAPFVFSKQNPVTAQIPSSLTAQGKQILPNGDFASLTGSVPVNCAASNSTITEDTTNVVNSANGYSINVAASGGIPGTMICTLNPADVAGLCVTANAHRYLPTGAPVSAGMVSLGDSFGITVSGYGATPQTAAWDWTSVTRCFPLGISSANVALYGDKQVNNGNASFDSVCVTPGSIPQQCAISPKLPTTLTNETLVTPAISGSVTQSGAGLTYHKIDDSGGANGSSVAFSKAGTNQSHVGQGTYSFYIYDDVAGTYAAHIASGEWFIGEGSNPMTVYPTTGAVGIPIVFGGNVTMTLAAGAAAGTSPTIACMTGHSCDPLTGTVTLTTGTSPTTGTLATLTWPQTHLRYANCVTQTLSASGLVTTNSWTESYTALTVTANTTLTASTAYTIKYWCGGN